MRRAGRLANALVGGCLALTTLGAGGLVIASVANASQPMTATTWVNMRSGPSTSNSVVAVLAPSEAVTASGKVSGGWHEVTTAQGQAGWVYQTYLQASAAAAPAPTTPTAPTASGSATTTSAVNVRTGPGTSHSSVAVAAKGTTLPTTGKTSGGWTEVIHGGQARWISTSYLTTGTASAPAPAPAPTASGTVYVNVGSLYVRATSAPDSTVIATVYRGDALRTTGRVVGDRLEVIHNGTARWVFRSYTTTVAPSTPLSTTVSLPGHDRLNANAKAVVQHVLETYPQIRTIGGYRASSDYSSDHPNGRAVDIMVSNWSQQAGIDYGTAIARDFQANAAKYNITYIIWRQQIWNASYPERGWRAMEDRGSSTANHYDHVHVSVR